MKDYEDEVEYECYLQRFMPTYRDLKIEQLRSYFTWRTKLRKGDYQPAPTPFVYIYFYELINQISTDSPEDSLQKMKQFDTLQTKEQALLIAQEELNKKDKEFKSIYEPIFNNHITVINQYLKRFTNYIKLKKFKWDKSSKTDLFRLLPVFDVYHEEVTFTSITPGQNEKTASYSLSEGDKSTIALCFFLGRLEINNNQNRIVIFDDPLSSFDYARRNSTILQLARIAQNSEQFFLLSHDMHFIYDFTRKASFLETINLKIENNGQSSVLTIQNLDDEYLTGTHKDINTIINYKRNPNLSDEQRRDVIRCLRPILEGIIKTKYFGIIKNDIWLGDIIEFVRNNDSDNRLQCLKDNLLDLIEINDYSHTYSHGSITDIPQIIDPNELNRIVDLLLEVRLKI